MYYMYMILKIDFKIKNNMHNFTLLTRNLNLQSDSMYTWANLSLDKNVDIMTLYIHHMASRMTYRNISPEVTRKLWRVMSPDAEGRGWHNAPGLSCHWGADILV